MKNRRIRISVFILVVILIVAAVCISAIAATKHYQVNQDGQTYGTMSQESHGTAPDLIQAQGVDGTIGYVKSTDLFWFNPKTPEEAVKMQAEMDAKGPYTIPLYSEDGKTVIGEFPMGGGTRYDNDVDLSSAEPAMK